MQRTLVADPTRVGARRGRDHGFTLLELLVVLTFVAFLTTAAGAMLSPRSPTLNQSAEEVMRFLRSARHQTLVSGKDTRIVIDSRTGLVKRDGVPPLVVEEGIDIEVYTDLGVAGLSDPELVFFGTGGATGGRLVLRKGDATRALEVRWLTGAIFWLETGA